jgi:hypothetical protein
MTDVDARATNDTPREAGADTSHGAAEARESQDVLTHSVGKRLTRESRDAQQPRWKRWLGKG